MAMSKSIWGMAVVAVVGLAGLAAFLLLRDENKGVRGPEALSAVRPESQPSGASSNVSSPPSVNKPIGGETPEPHSRVLMREIRRLAPSPAVRLVAGVDPAAGGYKERAGGLKALTRGLATNDVAALRLFLDARFKEQEKGSELGLLEFEGLKNDALSVLLAQDRPPEGLGRQLAAMFRDGEHDDVWRDYCVQYLGPYYDIRWPAGSKAGKDPEREEVEAAYWEALKETGKTFAGTALLGIERLSRARSEMGRTNVANVAVSLATNEACIEANRITAFRVSALMGKKEVLPSARMASQTGETGPLRMAAIATIGDLGDASDRELLESLAASKEERIRRIAKAALARLDAAK
jgi:hypothetical protein